MARNSDYIYDVAGGWQPVTAKLDEILNTSSFEEDHHKAIKGAGYSVNQFEKVEMPGFTIELYKSSYNADYPYLLEVSDSAEIDIIIIANYISLQKCITELVSNRKSYISATSS
jgi:hypothetical protein